MAYYWGGHSVKCRKFLFRLSNYVHPSVVRLYGEVSEVWKDYITSGCPSAQLYVEDNHKVIQKNDNKRDIKELIVVNEDVPCELWKKIIAQIISDDSVCIISGIHKSKQVLAMWHLIKEDPKVVNSFDLYDFGILFNFIRNSFCDRNPIFILYHKYNLLPLRHHQATSHQ